MQQNNKLKRLMLLINLAINNFLFIVPVELYSLQQNTVNHIELLLIMAQQLTI